MSTNMKVRSLTQRKIQLDMKKLEEAVHYICAKAGDTLGAVKLNKILYYADMLHYAHTGAPITGATYAKRQQGPVPKQVVPAIEHLVHAGRLSCQNISIFDFVKRKFDSHGETDISVFTKEEIERLDDMIREIDKLTAGEISEFSHHIVWRSAELGETLPYESFFVSYLGDLSDEDMARVQSSINAVERNTGQVCA